MRDFVHLTIVLLISQLLRPAQVSAPPVHSISTNGRITNYKNTFQIASCRRVE